MRYSELSEHIMSMADIVSGKHITIIGLIDPTLCSGKLYDAPREFAEDTIGCTINTLSELYRAKSWEIYFCRKLSYLVLDYLSPDCPKKYSHELTSTNSMIHLISDERMITTKGTDLVFVAAKEQAAIYDFDLSFRYFDHLFKLNLQWFYGKFGCLQISKLEYNLKNNKKAAEQLLNGNYYASGRQSILAIDKFSEYKVNANCKKVTNVIKAHISNHPDFKTLIDLSIDEINELGILRDFLWSNKEGDISQISIQTSKTFNLKNFIKIFEALSESRFRDIMHIKDIGKSNVILFLLENQDCTKFGEMALDCGRNDNKFFYDSVKLAKENNDTLRIRFMFNRGSIVV